MNLFNWSYSQFLFSGNIVSNLLKSAVLAKVEENLAEFFLKITKSTFKNFFSKKKNHQIFRDFCVFRGVIFATRKKKFKNVPTGPTLKVRPPVKQGPFFCGLIGILHVANIPNTTFFFRPSIYQQVKWSNI